MADTRIENSNIRLTLKTERTDVTTDDKPKFSISLKNPLPDSQSNTMIATINNINSSLSGSLAGMWYRDSQLGDYEVKKIVKAEILETTKTTSEDGKIITTVTRQNTFFESDGG